jgi:hypothetical protein
MQNRNNGIYLFCCLVCVWPLVFYGLVELIRREAMRRDWSNIDWRSLWSKKQ